MKRITFLLLLSCSLHSIAQQVDTNLIPYRKDGKWGYCTPAKKVVIQPQFTDAMLFYGPLTTAQQDSFNCVIDKRGNIIYKTRDGITVGDNGEYFIARSGMYHAQLFNRNATPVTRVYHNIYPARYGCFMIVDDYVKYGLLDKNYKEIVSPQYGSVEFYTEDIVMIFDRTTRNYGLFSIKAGKVIASGYDKIYPPHEGLFMVTKNNLSGFINMQGAEVISLKYTKERPAGIKNNESYNESTYENFCYDGFYNGLAVVISDGKVGYINKSGAVAIPFRYDKAYGFIGNYAWVQQNGKWGIINKQGSFVLQPVYKGPAMTYAKELSALDGFHEGLVPVAIDSLYGYADTTGKIVIPLRYRGANAFGEGMAPVYEGDKLGFISRKGEWLIQPSFSWVEGAGIYDVHVFNEGLAIALGTDDRWTVINKKGSPILPLRFDKEGYVSYEHGIFNAVADGKRYFFNKKGKVLYTMSSAHMVSQYNPGLFYDYGEKCLFNIHTKVKYCD